VLNHRAELVGVPPLRFKRNYHHQLKTIWLAKKFPSAKESDYPTAQVQNSFMRSNVYEEVQRIRDWSLE